MRNEWIHFWRKSKGQFLVFHFERYKYDIRENRYLYLNNISIYKYHFHLKEIDVFEI